jgi:pilus assembly protein CpaB
MLVVLALAIAMGLATSVMVYRTIARVPQGEPAEDIVVAAANIGLGEGLTSKHVKVVALPKSILPPGSLRAIKDAEGRVARVSIFAGEPIVEAKLAPAGQGGLMPVLIPPGKRGVSIKVDEAVQKSGFVLPNSRIDVLVTMARKGGEGRESKIILQDVTVLAADQTVEMKDNKPVTMTTVTMALSPEESERLALATNEGKVTFALRNLQDTTRVSTQGVTTAQLLGSPAPAPAAEKRPVSTARARARGPVRMAAPPPIPPPPQVHTVSVIRGVSSTEYAFIRDPERGWVESPAKADGVKKSR